MPTIIDQLRAELGGQLAFYHKGVANITRPGQPHRVGDKIGFQVFARNSSPSVAMKNLAGWIRHAAATSFPSVSFSVPALAPGEEKALGGKITADVVADTNDALWRDKIAFVDAAATADFSAFRFQDSGVLVDAIFPP